MRLFVGFECVDFERSPLLTFEPAILCSFFRGLRFEAHHLFIPFVLNSHVIECNGG